MKHLKAKLISATALLVLSAVMMTTASFAWFTISTNPEIANISANITSNGNLEIALDAGAGTAPLASTKADAGKNETWGNLVDLKGFFTGGTKDTVTLKPVQFTGTAMNKPVYGLDGRISDLTALSRVNAADATSGTDFKDFGGVWVYTDGSAAAAGTYDAHIYAFEVDYWLRTNATDSTVSLSTAVSRAEDATDTIAGETGLGSFITDEKNVTILIQDGTSWYLAKRGAVADGKYPLTLVSCTIDATTGVITEGAAASIALVKDTAKLLKMFVFMDGTTLTNADALLTETEFTMNIQFSSSATLVSMDVEMANHGRQ